jgi:hypothetical protein
MSNWRDKAACKNRGVAIFFTRKGTPDHDEALSYCEVCLVRDECLAYATASEEGLRYGIFGGISPSER